MGRSVTLQLAINAGQMAAWATKEFGPPIILRQPDILGQLVGLGKNGIIYLENFIGLDPPHRPYNHVDLFNVGAYKLSGLGLHAPREYQDQWFSTAKKVYFWEVK